ncbi:glycosyltransferase [Aquisphaera giovannonii]|uniref:glycosyltransferase n=1 Tax=Aquisphaera giovannonii TaxID=406548 RepID=UPI001AEFC6F7
MRRVDSPYVAFCDDDTWWEPGCLRRAADLMDASPRLAVVTARVLVGPEDREDAICSVLERSPLPRGPGMPGPFLLGFLAGASVVRRSAYLEAGGFETASSSAARRSCWPSTWPPGAGSSVMRPSSSSTTTRPAAGTPPAAGAP